MTDINATDLRHLKFLENRVRDQGVAVAGSLRDVADQIEREVKRAKDVLDIPYLVQHALAWGVVNANADMISSSAKDFVELRRHIETEEAERRRMND